MRSLLTLLLVAALATIPAVGAQSPGPSEAATWPAARHGHSMTFHTRLGMAMMYGDVDAVLWGWDGTRWRTFDGPSPGLLKHTRVVYDAARDRIVLFGGAGKVANGDTWEWNEHGWAKMTSDGPGPRMGFGMAYDPVRERVVLVGGLTGSRQWVSDTWEWDGRVWTKAADQGPPARLEAVMTWDPIARRLVYGGGASTTDPGGAFADVWTWDGKTWQSFADVSPLRWPQLVGHPLTSRPAFFGSRQDADPVAAVSGWNGTSWEVIAVDTPLRARQLPAAVLDTKRQRVIAFGGTGRDGKPLGDLWEWDGRTWLEIVRPKATADALASVPGPRS